MSVVNNYQQSFAYRKITEHSNNGFRNIRETNN